MNDYLLRNHIFYYMKKYFLVVGVDPYNTLLKTRNTMHVQRIQTGVNLFFSTSFQRFQKTLEANIWFLILKGKWWMFSSFDRFNFIPICSKLSYGMKLNLSGIYPLSNSILDLQSWLFFEKFKSIKLFLHSYKSFLSEIKL